MTSQELLYSVLHLAFQGKLIPQNKDEIVTDRTSFILEDAPFDVPDSWRWNKIGKCCDMYTGNSISESEKKTKYEGKEEGYDYIGTKDVSFEHVICYNNGVKIPYDTEFKIAYKDAILMCIEGGSAGRKIAILDRDVCFGNKLCMFRTSTVLNTYLFYYLQSSEFKKSFMDNMTGIIGGVSIKKLKDILLPVPPLAEQNRIVAKIEELLPLIADYEQAWTKLEDFNMRFPSDMQKSILQLAIQGKLVPQVASEGTGEDLYKQIQEEKAKLIKNNKIKKEKPLAEITEDEVPFEIPKNWEWVRLGNLIQFQGGYAYKSNSYVLCSDNQVIRLGNVKPNSLLLDVKQVFIPNDIADSTEDYRIIENDILVTMTGTRKKRDYFFTLAVKAKDLENRRLYLNQRVGCLRPIGNISVSYLVYVLQSENIKDLIFATETGTANQGNIGSEDMKRVILIPLPPLAEQKRIVEKLEELLPLCERLK